MGRWVVSLIIISAILLGGSLFWFFANRDAYKKEAMQSMLNAFQVQIPNLTGTLPPDFQFTPGDSWSFDLLGDELRVQAPRLEKKTGEKPSTEEFETARQVLLSQITGWLFPPGKKALPVFLTFRNETP